MARSATLYDKLGRVCRGRTCAVNPSSRMVGSAPVSNTWYDPLGRTLKQQGASSSACTKQVYDGLGRVTRQVQSCGLSESSYGDAGRDAVAAASPTARGLLGPR